MSQTFISHFQRVVILKGSKFVSNMGKFLLVNFLLMLATTSFAFSAGSLISFINFTLKTPCIDKNIPKLTHGLHLLNDCGGWPPFLSFQCVHAFWQISRHRKRSYLTETRKTWLGRILHACYFIYRSRKLFSFYWQVNFHSLHGGNFDCPATLLLYHILYR